MSGTYRVNKTRNYSVISNTPLNDTSLSWESRGVMAYLLSKPDGWECRNYDLVNQGCASEHIISRIVKELQDHGYIFRKKISEGRNKIRWLTEVYESPDLNPHFSIPHIFSLEKFEVEKVPDILSTESLVNTELELGELTLKLLLVCKVDFDTMTWKQKQNLAEVIVILEKNNITPAQLDKYIEFWQQSWRKASPPTLLQIPETWGEFKDWLSNPTQPINSKQAGPNIITKNGKNTLVIPG